MHCLIFIKISGNLLTYTTNNRCDSHGVGGGEVSSWKYLALPLARPNILHTEWDFNLPNMIRVKRWNLPKANVFPWFITYLVGQLVDEVLNVVSINTVG